jgi:hypothetical protein
MAMFLGSTRGRRPGSAPRRLDRGEAAGEVRPVLPSLELALSEEGLSLLTYGWEWDWVTPGPASKERDRLGGHRGAAVTVDGHLAAGMCCWAQVAAISFSARTADSRVATCAARKQDRGVDLRLR